MKHAAAARAELKTRTVFNLVGPLSNPAGATAQLVGAPSVQVAELMAVTLANLGLLSAGRSYMGTAVWTRSARLGESDVSSDHARGHRSPHGDAGGFRGAADDSRSDPRRRPWREWEDRPRGVGAERGPIPGHRPGERRGRTAAASLASGYREGRAAAAQSIDSGASAQVLARYADSPARSPEAKPDRVAFEDLGQAGGEGRARQNHLAPASWARCFSSP